MPGRSPALVVIAPCRLLGRGLAVLVLAVTAGCAVEGQREAMDSTGCGFDADCMEHEVCVEGLCLAVTAPGGAVQGDAEVPGHDGQPGPDSAPPDELPSSDTGAPLPDESEPDAAPEPTPEEEEPEVKDPEPPVSEPTEPPEEEPEEQVEPEEPAPSEPAPPVFVPQSIRIELSWGAPADLDLHLVRQGAQVCDDDHDCFFDNCREDQDDDVVEWDGVAGRTSGDPRLTDSWQDNAPEVVELWETREGDVRYDVVAGAYYIDTPSYIEIDYELRVYVDGALTLTLQRTLDDYDNELAVTLQFAADQDGVIGVVPTEVAPTSQPHSGAGCMFAPTW